MYVRVGRYVHVCMHMYVGTVCVYVYGCVCMHTRMYIHVGMYIRMCTCITLLLSLFPLPSLLYAGAAHTAKNSV